VLLGPEQLGRTGTMLPREISQQTPELFSALVLACGERCVAMLAMCVSEQRIRRGQGS